MKNTLTRALCVGFIGSLLALLGWGSKPKPQAADGYEIPACVLRGDCP